MRRLFAWLLTAFTLLPVLALAQPLPDTECFSPGFSRVREALNGASALSVSASLSAQDAFYARDLSVLNDMLSGATLRYDGAQGVDRLRILKGTQTLLDVSRFDGEDGSLLCMDGRTYALPSERELLTVALGFAPEEGGVLAALLDALGGALPLGRLRLSDVALALESLAVDDSLPGGLRVALPFGVQRTLSDDGLRVTRIDLTGALGFQGETAYAITGHMTSPGGNKPKDVLELSAVRDDDNALTLSGTTTWSVSGGEQSGTTSAQMRLVAQGKLGGSRVESRLTLKLTNNWSVTDQSALAEKITITAHVGHTDKRPGLRMLRLNDLSGDIKATLNLTTNENGGLPMAFTDEASLELKMDGNDFMSGSVGATVCIGAAELPVSPDPEAVAAQDGTEALFGEIARGLAAKLYARLSEQGVAAATKGLN